MKTKAVWYPPQQAPDPELVVFTTELGEDRNHSGKLLGKRYKLIQRIGSGATASVYEAKDLTTGAQVAVKILHSQLHAPLRAFFGQEGRIAARHDCPHLVQATDFGETRGIVYTVFSFVRGKPLRLLAGLDGSDPLPWRRLCRIVLQVLEALASLHKRGVVHRDLHSGNILVDESRDDFVVVIDVGFAAVIPPRRITLGPEPTRTLYGMYDYVAPEARAGCPPDPRMDLYAVGVLMFELLTGLEMIDYARNFGKLAVPPLRVLAPGLDIPEAIDAIVLRALSDVSVRFASADEMAAAIRAAIAEIDAAPAVRRDVLRPTMIASLGAACAVVGGLVVGGMLLAAQPAQPTLAAMNGSAEPDVRALDVRQPELLARAPDLGPEASIDPPDTADDGEPLCVGPHDELGPLAPEDTRAPPLAASPPPNVTTLETKIAAERKRPPLTAEQRLIRTARRSILDCKPAGSLSNAAVLIERRDGAVTVRFNGRPLQGQFGRCVADFAATAALGPSGRLEFKL
jgi:hypothetical protein